MVRNLYLMLTSVVSALLFSCCTNSGDPGESLIDLGSDYGKKLEQKVETWENEFEEWLTAKAGSTSTSGANLPIPKYTNVSAPIARSKDNNNQRMIHPGKDYSGAHYGIDISHWQGDVMSEIPSKDSLQFIICKATQGTQYVDPRFRQNWREIEEKGFIRGAYHFYVFADDPTTQAEHFAYTISDIDRHDIAPIVDVEWGGLDKGMPVATMQQNLLTFIKVLKRKLNRDPVIYASTSFVNEYLNNQEFLKYDLWIADYNGQSQPNLPTLYQNKGFLIWQKTDKYHAFSENLDFDVHFGTLKSLVKN